MLKTTATMMMLALGGLVFAQNAEAQTCAANTWCTVDNIYWHLRQPSSSSQEEREQYRINACRQKVNQELEVLRRYGMNPTVKGIEVIERWGDGSETKKDPWTGIRHHAAWGYCKCQYYFEL